MPSSRRQLRAGNEIRNAGTGQTHDDNLSRLDPVDPVDFCGACRRTWEDVVAKGFAGVGVYNVRFTPSRLEKAGAGASRTRAPVRLPRSAKLTVRFAIFEIEA